MFDYMTVQEIAKLWEYQSGKFRNYARQTTLRVLFI